jgi:hypothetical protein
MVDEASLCYRASVYEAWSFGHHGRRRVPLAGQNGDQHRDRVRIGQRAIAGISALDSRVDLIVRATHRPEHNDDILTMRTAAVEA